MKHCLVTIAIFIVVASALFANGKPEATLTIDAGKPTGNVSPTFFGLMTEAINHSYDGGLYAELVQNRAFLDSASSPAHWSLVQSNGSVASIALDPQNGLSSAVPTSLRLNVTTAAQGQSAGIANDGYWGIPVWPNTTYHASFYAKASAGFSGTIAVSIQGDDGTEFAVGHVTGLSSSWKKFDLTLTTADVPTTDKARLLLSVDQPGTVWFSIVSLFPPTWGNQPNGFRKDLMQMLIDLHPKFLRFPGGNFLEGHDIADRFDWTKTIGPLEDRSGHDGPWGYRSTDGMGLLEFLEWCEDMHAQPVLAVYAGYSLDGEYVDPGKDLEPYVQSALDEIEYVSGPVTSKWGAMRAKDGHPEPFTLKYVEIGNEDWFDGSASYDKRFTQFYRAIKAKYPDISLISTIGNDQPYYKQVTTVDPDVLDEHYYLAADDFIQNAPKHFARYKRQGPKIMVGEWASYETSFPPWDPQSRQEPPTPNMKAALGDADWMMAMERNADLVIMQCYAPLLVNVSQGARQWRPDLIGYDALHAYGSPSYYAMQMFSSNIGDEILSDTVADTDSVESSATKESGSGIIFVKLVNAAAAAVPVTIHLEGVSHVGSHADVVTMAADPDATNSLDNPKEVIPVTSRINNVRPAFKYVVPANAIVVLKVDSTG